EQYARPDISEIRAASTTSNPVGCALAAYYGGGFVGGLPGAVIGGAVGRDTGPALLGMAVGWSIGSVYVYSKCRHKPEKHRYSATRKTPAYRLISAPAGRIRNDPFHQGSIEEKKPRRPDSYWPDRGVRGAGGICRSRAFVC